MDPANVVTSLLQPNSDHMMIYLRDYNHAICHTQRIT